MQLHTINGSADNQSKSDTMSIAANFISKNPIFVIFLAVFIASLRIYLKFRPLKTVFNLHWAVFVRLL